MTGGVRPDNSDTGWDVGYHIQAPVPCQYRRFAAQDAQVMAQRLQETQGFLRRHGLRIPSADTGRFPGPFRSSRRRVFSVCQYRGLCRPRPSNNDLFALCFHPSPFAFQGRILSAVPPGLPFPCAHRGQCRVPPVSNRYRPRRSGSVYWRHGRGVSGLPPILAKPKNQPIRYWLVRLCLFHSP